MTRRQHLETVAVGVALFALHAWSLLRFPLPYVDEGWLAARAWGYLTTGRPLGDLDIGIFDSFDGAWTCVAFLPTWFRSLGLRFSSVPSLYGMRFVSLAFGMLLLIAIYAIGKRLKGWEMGIVSMLLVGLSYPFFYSAHLARSDVYAAAIGFGAIAVYLNNTRERFSVGLLCGLLLAIAFEMHQEGIIFGPVIGVLFIYDQKRALLRKAHFWGAVLGTAVGLAVYVAVHILPYPETYFAIGKLTFGPTHTPPLLTFSSVIIRQAFEEFFLWVPTGQEWTGALAFLGLLLLVFRRTESDIKLLLIVTTVILGFILLVRSKQAFHMILYGPALDLAVAAIVVWAVKWRPAKRWVGVAVGAAVAVVCLLAVKSEAPDLRPNAYAWYLEATDQIASVIRPGESVMGRQQYWFGLADHKFYSWESLVYQRRYVPGLSVAEAFAENKPDIFILDAGNGKFISDSRGSTLILEHLRLPAAEFKAFMKGRAEALTQFDGPYGQTIVFRIHWDNP